MSNFIENSIVIKSRKKVTLEVHINVFLPKKSGSKMFFEMGIWIVKYDGTTKNNKKSPSENLSIGPNNQNFEEQCLIRIDFPIKFDEKNFEDLKSKFEYDGKHKFTELIFNEKYKNIKTKNGKQLELEEVILHNKSSTSSIGLKGIQAGNYYRFRIKNISEDNLIVKQTRSSFICDPVEKITKVIGFHINNRRNFGDQDKSEDREFLMSNVSFSCVNTFILCDVGSDLLDSMLEKKSFRILEDDMWGDYLGLDSGNNGQVGKTIAYQFKKESKKSVGPSSPNEENFRDFKLFLKFLQTDSSLGKTTETAALIILLALVANLITSFCSLFDTWIRNKEWVDIPISLLSVVVIGIIRFLRRKK